MMELQNVIKERRSVRSFTEKKVEENKIRKIIDAGQWAPSACNKQAWDFIVIRDESSKRKLVKDCGASPLTERCPVLVYVMYRNDITVDNKANIQSGAAAVQNMLLTAFSLGLGSIWICQCGDRKLLRRSLKVPDNHDILCAVGIGYARENPSPPKRKALAEIMHEGFYRKGAEYMGVFPEEWDDESLMMYRENGIRAKSPDRDSFRPKFGGEFRKEVGIISGLIGKDDRVLDILPFSGNHAIAIAKESGIGTLDVFETSKQIADFIERKRKAMGIKCEIRPGISRVGKLPYKSDTFDVVTCVKKLEILPDPDVMLKEMSRVLRPGGKLILSVWNSKSVYGLNYMIKTGLMGKRQVLNNEGPVRPLSNSKVNNMLKGCNLRINSVLGINLIPRKAQSFVTTGPLKGVCRTLIFACEKP